jgi:ABC-2 type transport system ATP-binding protein
MVTLESTAAETRVEPPAPAGRRPAVEVTHLRKAYGSLVEEYRSFYRDPADVDELLDVLGLAAKRGDYYRSLSGGQRQRLSVALALIGQPRLAFLDEMTTGLDPQARRDTWELIEQIRDRGVTIILVTHFMEEAERPAVRPVRRPAADRPG